MIFFFFLKKCLFIRDVDSWHSCCGKGKKRIAQHWKTYRELKNLNYVGYVRNVKHNIPVYKRKHRANKSNLSAHRNLYNILQRTELDCVPLFCICSTPMFWFVRLLSSLSRDNFTSVVPAAAVRWFNKYLPSAGKGEINTLEWVQKYRWHKYRCVLI